MRLSPSKVSLIVIVIVTVGLFLNYHKDLIQAWNLSQLRDSRLNDRLMPHRVNDPGKLRYLLGKGVRSFETDLVFDAGTGLFMVGHDPQAPSRVPVDSLLAVSRGKSLRALWFDIKNLSPETMEPAAATLNRLDTVFGIRSYTIVESGTVSDSFAFLAEEGWHTSYYLPVDRLVALRDSTTEVQSESYGKLAEQVIRQRVSAVSFDLSVYPDVKRLLEPHLPESIVYHCWGAVKMWEWGVISRLQGEPWMSDPRVKTVLYRVWL